MLPPPPSPSLEPPPILLLFSPPSQPPPTPPSAAGGRLRKPHAAAGAQREAKVKRWRSYGLSEPSRLRLRLRLSLRGASQLAPPADLSGPSAWISLSLSLSLSRNAAAADGAGENQTNELHKLESSALIVIKRSREECERPLGALEPPPPPPPPQSPNSAGQLRWPVIGGANSGRWTATAGAAPRRLTPGQPRLNSASLPFRLVDFAGGGGEQALVCCLLPAWPARRET